MPLQVLPSSVKQSDRRYRKTRIFLILFLTVLSSVDIYSSSINWENSFYTKTDPNTGSSFRLLRILSLSAYPSLKNIDDNHSNDNQCNSDNGRQVRNLSESNNPDHGNKNNSYSWPDGIGNSYRDLTKCQAQKIKSTGISYYRYHRWPKFWKLFRFLQESGCYDFKYNC